ncbi:MAG: long-chain fatty acid--CoA ligase [Pyrinomonadaceae bacterium]|nr:long-chain fatty acid--CoA ligase [Pyrinomonadaceae bacterium]
MINTTSSTKLTSESSAPAPTTIPALCLSALTKYGKADAINQKQGDEWLHMRGDEFTHRVRRVALGLAALGIRSGDRVALISENRAEWTLADLAILSLGAINVPIYTTQAPDQVRFILQDSGARALFVSGRRVYRHAKPGIEAASEIENIIFFDVDAAHGVERATTLEAVERAGEKEEERSPTAFDELAARVQADDTATIIYTSGTTGEPKGVVLTHNNFVSNVLAISASLPISSADIALSVLPLSHIFERTVFYVFCWNGVSVYYAASFDQVGEHLKEVRPTIMTAVPRLFEKVYHRIVKQGTSVEGWKRRLFSWALETGKRYAELRDLGKPVPLALRAQQKIADRLVFSKWREGVGGRLRYFVSGGAPLSPALSYAFLAAGIPILQGYGMTETCIVSANRPENNRVGSVGAAFPGIEVKTAADGEILVRGPNIMRSYYGEAEATADVFTSEGWFQTGDVGRMDEEGRLYITDRKKELFKLSNGKYVAPQLVESLIKQSSLVNQVVVIGAGRKAPAALIVPDWDALAGVMAGAKESLPDARALASRDPKAIKFVQREVAALTAPLADYERVRRVALLPEELSIDGGELTPTLKVRRRVVDEKYQRLIEELYGGVAAETEREV